MFLRMKVFHIDFQLILKFIIISIAIIVFMPWVCHIYADTCGFEGSGLRIYIAGMDESWSFIWSASGIEKQKTAYSSVDSEDRLNMYRGSGDERSAGLPQDILGADMRLDVPFAVSHNGQMLISSVYPNHTPPLIISQKFAIIDLKTKRLLRIIETEHYVDSMAWSPTDKYFAVLLSQNVTSQKWKGPLDWISKFVGHPISYYTLYIAIYNFDGQFICKKTLIEKLAHGRGYIEWP